MPTAAAIQPLIVGFAGLTVFYGFAMLAGLHMPIQQSTV